MRARVLSAPSNSQNSWKRPTRMVSWLVPTPRLLGRFASTTTGRPWISPTTPFGGVGVLVGHDVQRLHRVRDCVCRGLAYPVTLRLARIVVRPAQPAALSMGRVSKGAVARLCNFSRTTPSRYEALATDLAGLSEAHHRPFSQVDWSLAQGRQPSARLARA